jgi:hypothetical protein
MGMVGTYREPGTARHHQQPFSPETALFTNRWSLAGRSDENEASPIGDTRGRHGSSAETTGLPLDELPSRAAALACQRTGTSC